MLPTWKSLWSDRVRKLADDHAAEGLPPGNLGENRLDLRVYRIGAEPEPPREGGETDLADPSGPRRRRRDEEKGQEESSPHAALRSGVSSAGSFSAFISARPAQTPARPRSPKLNGIFFKSGKREYATSEPLYRPWTIMLR